MAAKDLNIKLNITPEMNIKAINVMLAQLKKSMGSLGQGIQLIDEKKYATEMRNVQKVTEKVANEAAEDIDKIKVSFNEAAAEALKYGKAFQETMAKGKGLEQANEMAKSYRKSLSLANKEIKSISQALALMEQAGKKDTKEFKAMQQSLLKAQGNADKLKNSVKQATVEAKALKVGVKQIDDQLEKTASSGVVERSFKFNQVAQSLTMMTQALDQFIQPYIELDKQVQNIGTLGVKNLDEIRAASSKLATEIPGDAAMIGQAWYQLVSAGQILPDTSGIVNVADSIEFISVAAKDAVSGLSDTSTAVDLYTSVMNAYGMSAKEVGKVSNSTFAAIKMGKTTFEELASATATWLPLASSVGVSFDEINSTIATMTAQGTPTAQAATQIRAGLVLLEKGGPGLNKALKSQGRSLSELKEILQRDVDKGGGFVNAMEEVRKIAEKAGISLPEATGRIEAASLIMSTTGEKLGKTQAAFASFRGEVARGVAAEAFEVASQSISSTMDGVLSSIQAGFNGLWDAIGPGAVSTIGVLNKMAPAMMGIGSAMSLLPIGKVGELSKGLLTKLIPSLFATDAATKAMSFSMKGLGLAMKGLAMNPFGAVIIGIIAAVAALKFLSDAMHDTAAEQKEALADEIKLVDTQTIIAEKRVTAAKQNMSLIDSYKALGDQIEGNVESDINYTKSLTQLNLAYPGVVDSTKSYEENLAALEGQTEKSSEQLLELEANLTSLAKQKLDLKLELATADVGETKENLEDLMTDEFKEINWEGLLVPGIGGVAMFEDWIGEFALGTSTARKSAESQIHSLTEGIYKAWSESDVDIAIAKAQLELTESAQFKGADPKAQNQMLNAIEQMGEKQKARVKANMERLAFEANIGLQKMVGEYNTLSEKLKPLKLKVDSGDATDKEIQAYKDLEEQQKAAGDAIRKQFETGVKKGYDVQTTVDRITKAHGMTENEVKKILNIQGKITKEIDKSAEGAEKLGDKFKGVLSEQKATRQAALDALMQLKMELEDGTKNQEEYNAAAKEYVDIAVNTTKRVKELGKIKSDLEKKYSIAAKKAGKTKKEAQESEYKLAKKLFDVGAETLKNDYESYQLATEMTLLEEKRTANIYDEIDLQQKKIKSTKDELELLKEKYKIVTDKEGEIISYGIKFTAKELDAGVKQDIQNQVDTLGNEISQETFKELKLTADLEVSNAELKAEIANIERQRVELMVSLGMESPDKITAMIKEDLNEVQQELDSTVELIVTTKSEIESETDEGKKNILLARLQDYEIKRIELEKTELDITSELSAEYSKMADAQMDDLQDIQGQEMDNYDKKSEAEKALFNMRIDLARSFAKETIGVNLKAEFSGLEGAEKEETRIVETKYDDKKMTSEEKRTAKKEAEKAEEIAGIKAKYDKKREEAEKLADAKLAAIDAAARGAAIEAERQQAVALLKVQRDAKEKELELAIASQEAERELMAKALSQRGQMKLEQMKQDQIFDETITDKEIKNAEKKVEKQEKAAAKRHKDQDPEDSPGVKKVRGELDAINTEIELKGDLIKENTKFIESAVTDIFASFFEGDEEAMKAPWKNILGVLAGGLKQFVIGYVMEMALMQSLQMGPWGFLAIPAITVVLSSIMDAVLNPILSGLSSFATGGRVDSPTAAIVGDNPYSSEWILRDFDIKRMLAEQTYNFAILLDRTMGKYFNNSDISQQNMMDWANQITQSNIKTNETLEQLKKDSAMTQKAINEFKGMLTPGYAKEISVSLEQKEAIENENKLGIISNEDMIKRLDSIDSHLLSLKSGKAISINNITTVPIIDYSPLKAAMSDAIAPEIDRVVESLNSLEKRLIPAVNQVENAVYKSQALLDGKELLNSTKIAQSNINKRKRGFGSAKYSKT